MRAILALINVRFAENYGAALAARKSDIYVISR